MKTAAVAFAALFLLLAAPAPQQAAGVEELLQQIERSRLDDLWGPAQALLQLGRPAVPDIRHGLTHADAKVRLACAFVMYSQGFPDEAAEVYRRLLAEPDEGIVAAAAKAFSSQAGTDPAMTGPRLHDYAGDARRRLPTATGSTTQVALWTAIMRFEPTAEPPRAILEIFRRATDRPTRDAAALALAEMDSFNEVRSHLLTMSAEPTTEGRAAAAYLKVMRLQEDLLRRHAPHYDFTLIEQAMDILTQNYVDAARAAEQNRLIEAALRGLCSALDPYTAYYDAEAITALREEDLGGRYGGIGARVAMTRDRVGIAWLTITEPIFSGPAYRAGIRSGDRITEVEGETTANRDLQVLVSRLRGPAGGEVHIKVYSRRWLEEREFTISREQIQLPMTQHRMLPGNIGYIKLVAFGEENAAEMREAIEDMTGDGMRALILDLRGNTGGYLNAAVEIADLFLGPGLTVVTSRGREGVEAPHVYRTREAAATEAPLVVLVDGASASASEILAGALMDHQRATLVGTRTFGKGSVQRLMMIPASGTPPATAVRVTTARWYLPSERSVEAHDDVPGGIEPNLAVEPAERDLWLEAESERFRVEGHFDRYLQAQYDGHRDQFRAAAEWDGDSTDAYPDFDALYADLHTQASREQVRELLREAVRAHVADDLGENWIVDYETDRQLQRGILRVCEVAGIDPHSVDRYDPIARSFEQQPQAPENPDRPQD